MQKATEILSLKRDDKSAQFHALISENKALESKVFELERQLRNLDNSTKTAIVSSEERLAQLQQEMARYCYTLASYTSVVRKHGIQYFYSFNILLTVLTTLFLFLQLSRELLQSPK